MKHKISLIRYSRTHVLVAANMALIAFISCITGGPEVAWSVDPPLSSDRNPIPFHFSYGIGGASIVELRYELEPDDSENDAELRESSIAELVSRSSEHMDETLIVVARILDACDATLNVKTEFEKTFDFAKVIATSKKEMAAVVSWRIGPRPSGVLPFSGTLATVHDSDGITIKPRFFLKASLKTLIKQADPFELYRTIHFEAELVGRLDSKEDDHQLLPNDIGEVLLRKLRELLTQNGMELLELRIEEVNRVDIEGFAPIASVIVIYSNGFETVHETLYLPMNCSLANCVITNSVYSDITLDND